MTKQTYTPGPWGIEKWDRACLIISGQAIIAPAPDSASREEREANARLIAAAPELLEACKEALVIAKHLKHDADSWLYVELAKKAIAKAEGRHA